MTLWISTFNPGKFREFQELLKDLPIEVHGASELKHHASPPETGKTFFDNADIKARALKALKPGTWVLADDSGLEVEGLGGLPGVHSARYAGNNAQPSENNAKLLKMLGLRSPNNRKAQFSCTLVAYSPEGEQWSGQGLMKGEIALKAQGQGGFGYDPIFIPEGQPEGQNKTLASLPPIFKAQNSHRAKAFKAFRDHLVAALKLTP